MMLSFACADPRTKALGSLRGVQLSPARAKPDFTLTDTEGRPFSFRSATAGSVTLLYFGYTNCVDVCPVHMANIAAALRAMPADQQAHVRVVFVTTDPARDTPQHLREWLNNFDPRFIGLRGNTADINQIETSLGLPASSAEPMAGMAATDSAAKAPASGRAQSYEVGHAAQVLAFSPDDSLRTEYSSGTSRADWENDLPKLIQIHGK
ncbi:MAG TPA: SCO family protein [Gemmatimonadaceae bacterium]|jgi:protein SCO1/2